LGVCEVELWGKKKTNGESCSTLIGCGHSFLGSRWFFSSFGGGRGVLPDLEGRGKTRTMSHVQHFWEKDPTHSLLVDLLRGKETPKQLS